MKRIVISGVGIISIFGLNKGTFLENIASKSIYKLHTEEELEVILKDMKNQSPLTDYELSGWRLMDSLSKKGVAASLQAITDAGIDCNRIDPAQLGVFLGTVFGCLESNVKFHEKLLTSSPRYVSRTTFTNTVSNAAVGQISLILGAKGMHLTCASGGVYPLIYGIQQIRAGRVAQALVGGMESLDPIAITGLEKYGYGAKRDFGFVPRSGAGALVIEGLEECIGRQGQVLAEIVGYGVGPSFAISMQEALHRAQLSSSKIQSLILNGNGRKGDGQEMAEIEQVFGTDATLPPLFPIKRWIGETFGAGLSLSIAAALAKSEINQWVMVNSASFDSRAKGTFILKKYHAGQEE